MPLLYRSVFPAMWLTWMLYWWVASNNVKITVRRESVPSRLVHMVPLWFAMVLLWGPHARVGVLNQRFLPLAAWTFWIGSVLTAAGLLFAVWARLHLGRNWSCTVTIKDGHELITSGPYALVRHPIYTGLLLALLGTALALGEWRGLLAVALAGGAFWFKLRIEERWMRQQFGAAYLAYAHRVRALVPFVL